jgi:hypothetical protein
MRFFFPLTYNRPGLLAYSGLSRPPIPEEREHLIRRNASGVSGLARALNPGASGLSEGSGLSMFFLDVSMPGK